MAWQSKEAGFGIHQTTSELVKCTFITRCLGVEVRNHYSFGIMLYCLVGLAILLCVAPQVEVYTQQDESSSFGGINRLDIAAVTPHTPINISNNQDFILQGWPGNGTQAYPYMIEELQIDGEGNCINISNTDVFFIIGGCVLDRHSPYSERGYCIYLHNVTNGVISACSINSNYHGILLNASESCSIEQCLIDVESQGVYFDSCSASRLINSTVRGGSSAVVFDYSSNIEIKSNDIDIGSYGFSGIGLYYTVDFMIFNNSVSTSLSDGIAVHYSSNGVISNNSLESCLFGIRLDNVTSCDVLMNEAFENQYGFHFEYTHGCHIQMNSIHNNILGIKTWGSNDTYSVNWFNENTGGNAIDNGQDNLWFQNWWDDYVGYGLYPLLGSTGSFDIDPLPKNDLLFIGTTSSLLAVSVVGIVFVVMIIRRVRRSPLIDASATDWDTKEHLARPLMALVLIPSGVNFFFPVDSPARPFLLGITPFGVISWTAYPSRGHAALEFMYPLTDNFALAIFYMILGIAWILLSVYVIRRFWLFAGGDIQRSAAKKSILAVILIMILVGAATMTLPLPLVALAALLQMSRFKNQRAE